MTRSEFIQDALTIETYECILWPFAVRNSGYGAYSERLQGHTFNYDVHRYVCRIAHGQPEMGEEAAHSCGNRLCINKRHLSWKYPIENMEDAIRHGTLIGGGRYRQRITLFDRMTILASKESYSTLAKRYGTDVAYIGKLRRQPLPYDL